MPDIDDALTGLCENVWIQPGCTGDPVAIGIVTGGSFQDTDPPVHRRGVGGVDRLAGGYLQPKGTINFLPTDDSTWMETGEDYVQRPQDGVYPCTDLATYCLHLVAGESRQWLNARTNSLSLESAVGQALTASLAFTAENITSTSGVQPSPGTHWEWYDAVITFEMGSYSVQGFTVNLDNNTEPISDMDGLVGLNPRTPKRVIPKDEVVRVTIRTYAPIPDAVRQNLEYCPVADLNFDATFTSSCSGAAVFTIAVANLMAVGGEVPIEGEAGVIVYNYNFDAQVNSGALAITVTP